MNVIVPAASRQKEGIQMKTFTIDTDNNISVFATPEEAAATTTTPFDTYHFTRELPPFERMVRVDRHRLLPYQDASSKLRNGTS